MKEKKKLPKERNNVFRFKLFLCNIELDISYSLNRAMRLKACFCSGATLPPAERKGNCTPPGRNRETCLESLAPLRPSAIYSHQGPMEVDLNKLIHVLLWRIY